MKPPGVSDPGWRVHKVTEAKGLQLSNGHPELPTPVLRVPGHNEAVTSGHGQPLFNKNP